MAKTQCEVVLEHLREHGTITALEAMEQYGIMRLASRISDLREGGCVIDSRKVTRNGKTFAEYTYRSDNNRCEGCIHWRQFGYGGKACHYAIDTGELKNCRAADCTHYSTNKDELPKYDEEDDYYAD